MAVHCSRRLLFHCSIGQMDQCATMFIVVSLPPLFVPLPFVSGTTDHSVLGCRQAVARETSHIMGENQRRSVESPVNAGAEVTDSAHCIATTSRAVAQVCLSAVKSSERRQLIKLAPWRVRLKGLRDERCTCSWR